jgi:hypothetical protein
MPHDRPDGSDQLTPRERARVRRRDRKRTTVMVVDNAGVKRTAPALARRRAAQHAPDGSAPPPPA